MVSRCSIEYNDIAEVHEGDSDASNVIYTQNMPNIIKNVNFGFVILSFINTQFKEWVGYSGSHGKKSWEVN